MELAYGWRKACLLRIWSLVVDFKQDRIDTWEQDWELLDYHVEVGFDSYFVYPINNTNHEYNNELHESKACIFKQVVFNTMNS